MSPINRNGKLKLIIVMVLVPLILNAINFWLIDNILKLKTDEIGNESIREIYLSESGNSKNFNFERINKGNNIILKYKPGKDNKFENEQTNRIYGIVETREPI